MSWPDRYFPKEVEQKLYQHWEKNNYFSPDATNINSESSAQLSHTIDGSKNFQFYLFAFLSRLKNSVKNFLAENKAISEKYFSIVLPPPNVTGSLHLGHALNHTIQDCLLRWKKMNGLKAVWLPGTDHAGIATQIQVEKQLAKTNQTKHDIGRDEFLKKTWAWKHKYGGEIIQQMKRLGDSCHWKENLFTLDPSSAQAVKKAFVHLYKKGWIYQGTRLVNWSSGLSSALSDLEVEYREVDSHLWKIRYPLKDKKDFLIIATTRPETLLADQAVAVHPDDDRYKKYHNQKVILPLMNRELPIIADRYVDPEFETGAVKITPAHDFNDYKIGKTHKLKELNILTPDGRMNHHAGSYEGLSVLQARKKVVEDLKKQGLIENIKPYRHQVAFCSRSGSVIEPFLSKQWFMKMDHLAKRGLESVTDGSVELIPHSWAKTFKHWMDNIDDWCLSRQLWWGHRIPAWLCLDCKKITVTEHKVEKCGHCSSLNIKQEEDVLDTWFSSALWPMSVLKWPVKNLEQNVFYPTSVLVTAPDILFFWVARMIMMSLEFQNKVPFKTVYLHGVVRDEKGQKMSKSLGNGEDPIDLIEEYGADALRLSLLSSHARGRDVRFSRKNIEVCRNFLNKIWNAGRFIHSIAGSDESLQKPKELSSVDQWLLNKLKKTEIKINEDLKNFRFSSACMEAYQFTWMIFCDWYLEWIKPVVYGKDKDKKMITGWVSLNVFNHLLRLLHPFIPFITEEIYHKHKKKDSLLLSPYPKGSADWFQLGSDKKEQEIDFIREIISTLRRLRGENNIKPSQKLRACIFIPKKLTALRKSVAEYTESILFLARLEKLEFVDQAEVSKLDAVQPLAEFSDIKVILPLEGLVDMENEKQRLEKKINKLKIEKEKLENRLAQEDFISKAPAHVVEEHQNRKKEIESLLKELSLSLDRLH